MAWRQISNNWISCLRRWLPLSSRMYECTHIMSAAYILSFSPPVKKEYPMLGRTETTEKKKKRKKCSLQSDRINGRTERWPHCLFILDITQERVHTRQATIRFIRWKKHTSHGRETKGTAVYQWKVSRQQKDRSSRSSFLQLNPIRFLFCRSSKKEKKSNTSVVTSASNEEVGFRHGHHRFLYERVSLWSL